MSLQFYERDKPASEIMKTCFWILCIDAWSKGRRVERALTKIKGFVEDHPVGEKYRHLLEDGMFSTITKADKGRGELIRRIGAIHRFCFAVIEHEAVENAS